MTSVLNVTREKRDFVDIIYLSGRLDTITSAIADRELAELTTGGSKKILVNLKDLDYISSSGLRVMLVNLRKLREQKGDLKLACPKTMVKEIFHLAGFDRIFLLYGSEDEALKSFVHIALDEKETRIIDVIASTIAIEEDRRRTEENLQQSEKLYRTIFENTGTAMAIVEEDMTIFLVNSMFEKLVGHPKQDLEESKNLLSFVIRDDVGKVMEYQNKLGNTTGATSQQFEFRLKDRKGNIRIIYMIQDIIPGTSRRVNSLIDITELRKIEEDLRHELIKKREFIVLAAHELRTPLQPVLLYLNMILEDAGTSNLDPEIKDMVEKCLGFINHETDMVELILKLNSTGDEFSQAVPQLQPQFREISPEQEIQSHIKILKYSTEVSIAIDIPKDLLVKTDKEYFYMIIESLIFDLISYSPSPKKIEIGYRRSGIKEEFHIRNASVVLSEEILPNVFKPFYVGDDSKLLDKYGFVGMSVPFAKKMAESIGGDITIESNPGIGTVFTLSLPKTSRD